MTNILLDTLPETVEIDGAEYWINSDFRISILFELLMQDDEVGKRQKLMQGLSSSSSRKYDRGCRKNDLVLQVRQKRFTRSVRKNG